MKTYAILLLVLLCSSPVLFAQQGWKFKNPKMLNNLRGAICPINKDTVYVIGDKGQFFKTYDGGTNWTAFNTGFLNLFFDLSFCSIDTGYAVGEKGTIIKTVNGGTTWASLSSGTTNNLSSISAANPDNLWVVGDSGIVLNSDNKGIAWVKNNSLATNQLNSVCFRNANVGFIAGSKGTLLGTVNGGKNWNPITMPATGDLFSLTITANCAYLLSGTTTAQQAIGGNKIYKTTDNLNWTALSSYPGFPGGTNDIYFPNDSVGYAIGTSCTTNGFCGMYILKTTNYGQTWKKSLDGAPFTPPPAMVYSKITFVSDKVGYAFSGSYVLKTTDGGSYTLLGVEEENAAQYVNIFPSPFSSHGTIQVPRPLKDATLTVYNMYGQIVKQLRNVSGTTIIVQRDSLPSGCYMVNLTESNTTLATGKFVIVD